MDFIKNFSKKQDFNKQRQDEARKFLEEYKQLIEKYKFDFKAVLNYTPDGIFVSFKIIDLTRQDDTSRDNKPNQ
ncbi:MAG: hypothetical protein ABIL76_06045 [candidate division WOR-3 bacterium]